MNLIAMNGMRMEQARIALRDEIGRVRAADNGAGDGNPDRGAVSLVRDGVTISARYRDGLFRSELQQKIVGPDGSQTLSAFKVPHALVPFKLAEGSEFHSDPAGEPTGAILAYTESNGGQHYAKALLAEDARNGFLLADSSFR